MTEKQGLNHGPIIPCLEFYVKLRWNCIKQERGTNLKKHVNHYGGKESN